jgi:hypothetical protein
MITNSITFRLDELTGGNTTDINEALDQWENEREALSQFADENQALEIYTRRLNLTLGLAEKAISLLESEAGMFISQKTRDRMQQFREQLGKTRNAATQSKMILDNAEVGA